MLVDQEVELEFKYIKMSARWSLETPTFDPAQLYLMLKWFYISLYNLESFTTERKLWPYMLETDWGLHRQLTHIRIA